MLRHAEKEIVCVAEYFAKPGAQDELLRLFQDLIPLTRKETGCLRYELNLGLDNPPKITFIEKYASREDFDFHCATAYIKNIFENVVPRLVESYVITLYKEILP